MGNLLSPSEKSQDLKNVSYKGGTCPDDTQEVIRLKRDLQIANVARNKHEEGAAYFNLGLAYRSLKDFKRAIDYHELSLNLFKETGCRGAQEIFKEVGDKGWRGKPSYGNFGNAYQRLRNFRKVIEYQQLALGIFKKLGDKAGEGNSYCNLGNAYDKLGNFIKAIEYQQLALEIFKEVDDKAGEGNSYGNIGNAYYGLGNFKKAIEYQQLALVIRKEVGDKSGGGSSYCSLGATY
ncbi:G-protein-signaling modulator 2-like [Stylophora pistillata]|uniref:G-protein-signaling modulator 2-like n=1 Tax=Stylophora pistillata TaxID=50429 RepID=UPI000C045672|nr:G-protein-signaling modulator 2-like [Stylophora pistillata]